MRTAMASVFSSFALILIIGLAQPQQAAAQQLPPGITATRLLKSDVSGDPNKDSFISIVEFAPGATTFRHFHDGDEFATVIEGEVQINVEGQQPRIVKAGEAYHNNAHVPHETKNISTSPAKVVSTFLIDKGKPITTLLPATTQ